MRLFLDDHMLEVGDAFHLFFTLHGAPSIETIFDCYVLLDVYGSYWSWPSWRALEVGLDYQTVAVAPDAEVHEDVLHFVWPQGTGQADGLVFWGVSCHSGSFSIAGQLQSLTFSYNG